MIPVAASAVAVAVGGFIVFQGIQNVQEVQSGYEEDSMEDTDSANDTESAYDIDASGSGTVTWNGKTYRYNERLSNYLFLGVDKAELVETEAGYLDAGQTDAIFLVAWDRVDGKLTVVCR